MRDDTPPTLVLTEETAIIDKRRVETGRVRVRLRTESVEETARAELEGEAVEVTRVPIGRLVDAAPPFRTEGDVTVISIVEEVLVIEKRLNLKEEVHIRRRTTRETVETPVMLRRQHAEVERIDPDTGLATPEPLSSRSHPDFNSKDPSDD
jgi:stress response protein YsnF